MTGNVPQIRFANFDDAWEQRKLGSFTNVKTGSSDVQDAVEDGLYPFFVRSDVVKRSNKYVFDCEAILVPGEGRLGEIFHYYNGKFDCHQRVYKISDFVSVSGRFVLYAMQHSFKKHALQHTVKATVDSIRLPTLTEYELAVPASISEQCNIAGFFQQLDDLITLHQRKYEKLLTFKKSMLEKMFPKDGATEPEIRFAGFSDPWEQRKLGDVVVVGSGRDYKHLNKGSIPVYGTGGYMLSVDEALSEIEDAIGIGRKGTIDKPYLLKAPFWTVDTLFYCIPKDGFDLQMVLQLFNRVSWKQKDESTGVPSLSKEAINDVDVMIPEKREQQQIGTFFQRLDNLITLHQRELDKLKTMKESLLQKMFV